MVRNFLYLFTGWNEEMNDNKTKNQNRLQLFVEMINHQNVVLRVAELSQVKFFHHLFSPRWRLHPYSPSSGHFHLPFKYITKYIPAIHSCTTFARYWETSFSPWPAWSSSLPTGLWDLPCLPQATSWWLTKFQTVFLLTENHLMSLCVW